MAISLLNIFIAQNPVSFMDVRMSEIHDLPIREEPHVFHLFVQVYAGQVVI
ncbi:hypothetical protein KIS4809_4250 [Bacillus sp. ZZV12-4809]|nr:hypothetical protein KIS4809_4250 [Bacillus sp. ZZV12-4809]